MQKHLEKVVGLVRRESVLGGGILLSALGVLLILGVFLESSVDWQWQWGFHTFLMNGVVDYG